MTSPSDNAGIPAARSTGLRATYIRLLTVESVRRSATVTFGGPCEWDSAELIEEIFILLSLRARYWRIFAEAIGQHGRDATRPGNRSGIAVRRVGLLMPLCESRSLVGAGLSVSSRGLVAEG